MTFNRTKSGGASEVGALFGCHPWLSEYSLWATKTGLLQEREDSERLNAGRFLEPAIVDEINRVTGSKFIHNTTPMFYSPRVSATPDGVWGELNSVLDVKTVQPFMAEYWKAGTPEYIKWQLRQQMLCTNANRAMTGAMFGFSNPRYEWMNRDLSGSEDNQIITAWGIFWDRVDGKLPPPEVDGHRATTAALSQTKPQVSTIELGPETYEWSRELAMLEAKSKEPEARIAELKNKIRAALGDNGIGVFPDGSGFKLITVKESTSTRKAHVQMRRVNGKETIKEYEQ